MTTPKPITPNQAPGSRTASRAEADVESFINEYYAAWQGTDEDQIMAYYSEDVAVQIPGSLLQGQTAVREQFVRPYITGFPEIATSSSTSIFGPEEVTVEFTFDAQHTGPFAGYAATDAHVQVAGCGVYQYRLSEAADHDSQNLLRRGDVAEAADRSELLAPSHRRRHCSCRP